MALPVVSGLLNSCEQNEEPLAAGGTEVINLNDYPPLQQQGAGIVDSFDNSGGPVIIIRKSDTEFLVATAVCTHQGCTVSPPDEPGKLISCPCHGSVFSPEDASVLAGPAERPLSTFEYTYDADSQTLTINFSEKILL